MRLSTFAFYLAPLVVVPSTVAFFIYKKGGTELLVAQWPEQAGAFAVFCVTSFVCYTLDTMLTGRKPAKVQLEKQKTGATRIVEKRKTGATRIDPLLGETE